MFKKKTPNVRDRLEIIFFHSLITYELPFRFPPVYTYLHTTIYSTYLPLSLSWKRSGKGSHIYVARGQATKRLDQVEIPSHTD